MKKLVAAIVAVSVVGVSVLAMEKKSEHHGRQEMKLEKMKYFVDTHDRTNRTFPAQIDKAGFAKFAVAFEEACRAEGVVLLRVHASLEDGRAYCLTAAPSIDAVRRAHEKVGLPFEKVTEVYTVTPGDMYP